MSRPEIVAVVTRKGFVVCMACEYIFQRGAIVQRLTADCVGERTCDACCKPLRPRLLDI